jgi:hypothetical protein
MPATYVDEILHVDPDVELPPPQTATEIGVRA